MREVTESYKNASILVYYILIFVWFLASCYSILSIPPADPLNNHIILIQTILTVFFVLRN